MLRPEDISAIFEWIELLLIGSLKRNLASHKQEEEKEGFNWTSWQAEKLRNVDTFRRQSKAIMDRYTDVIDSETRELLEEQFAEGVNGADVPPAESVPDTPAEVTPEPHFFGVDKTKVNKLIEDVSYLEKNAETAALRLTDDVYRQTVNRVQFAMSTGSISYGQAVDMAVADFLTQGINCIEYKDGRRVNIADYVRMVLRTTSTRAALQGKSAKFKAQGYDTVLVSSYGMCSKTCLPWQGRAYIEDTFSYWDGEVEERNGILYGKSNYCGKWFPLLSSAIEKGLFHPNCRHSINQYIDGVTKLPEPIDNSDSERRYKEEQVLRSLEREVRKAKRKVEGFTDAENIKKAKAELREAQKNVREYIAKVNAEEGARVLVRNPLQEKIYSGDVRIGSSAEPVHAPESLPANVSDGHSVEVDIPAPDNGQPEYTDTPIPKNVHNSSVTDKVTAEERTELLSKGKVVLAENAKSTLAVSKMENTTKNVAETENVHEIKSSSDIQFDKIDGSKPITEEFAKEYRKEYDNFTHIFGELPNLSGISISPYKGDDVYGRYFDSSRGIVLYGVGGKDGKKYISQVTQDMKGKDKWSTASPYHTLRHELGHAYQQQLELSDKNWNKKFTLLSNYRQQLAINLTNQPESGKIKTEKDILSKYGMLKPDEFISESIAEYADKKEKSRPVSKKTVKILMMGEDNMLMSLPDEMYEYVDITGKEPVVMANAPDYIKKKAEEINAKSFEATGKKFFSEIK